MEKYKELTQELLDKCERKINELFKKLENRIKYKDIDEIIDANHDGCEHCNKGYRGRIAIQEVLEIDDFIRAALNNPEIDKEELKELVYGSGNVITLLQDGLRKILDGSTTFEEIYRIIEIDNDINDSCYISDTSKLSEDERLKIEEERSRELSELKKMREVSNANVATSTTSIVQPTDAKNVADILPVVPSNLNATNNVVPNVDQVVINIDNNESDNKSVSDITPIETKDIANSLIPEVPNNLEIKE